MRSVVLCEKPSQAQNLKAALGDRFGTIVPAQGHLFTLAPPEHYDPAWSSWEGFKLLRPQIFAKVPTSDPDPKRQAQLDRRRKVIADAIKGADRVIIATDCDREGQVIGTEILDALGFRGERLRAMFTSEDEASLRDAFEALRSNEDYAPIYQAGLARERADQIYNLSLTRAATSALVPDGVRTVLGVGRVRTPTLAIVCLREMSIVSFKPATSYGLAVTVNAGDTSIELRWRPQDGEAITDKATVEKMRAALVGQTARLSVESAKKSKAGPRPADLSTLQEIAGGWGWTATKVMDVAQSLYDQHKAITYVRAETRYLPERAIEAATPVVAVLQGMAPWSAGPAQPPNLRKGKAGVFWDQGLAGESHHAIMPNPKTIGQLAQTAAAFSPDERRLFGVVATLFLQALAPDHQYEETTISLEMDGNTSRPKY